MGASPIPCLLQQAPVLPSRSSLTVSTPSVKTSPFASAWQARVRYHDIRGRPIHSKRVLEWNGLYVLYDLHFPPGASLPSSATSSTSSVSSTITNTSDGEEGVCLSLWSSNVVPCTQAKFNDVYEAI